MGSHWQVLIPWIVVLTSCDAVHPRRHRWNRISEEFSLGRTRTQIFSVPLDAKQNFELKWAPFFNEEKVVFLVKAQLPKKHWLGVGFSDYGNVTGADLCFYWEDWKGRGHMQDGYVQSSGALAVDKQQDCQNFQYARHGDSVIFTFTRRWITCDKQDFQIEDGTVHLVYTTGSGPLFSVEGVNVVDEEHGFQRTRLLQVVSPPDENAEVLDILADKVEVPPLETTYWCHVMKIPEQFREKHHVVQFESNIEKGHEGLVHHMEVFHCDTDPDVQIPEYRGPCEGPDRPKETRVCKQVLAAWAFGAGPFVYPKEAGLAFGGKNFNKYVMLEVHYNNPLLKSDWIDSSGVRLRYIGDLRKFDAGIMELGLEYTDKMAIPPGQKSFVLSGYCVPECTAVGLPQDGITVFGSQLHTHLTGFKVMTRHIRNGKELPTLNRDDHYSTHFQEIRLLKNPVDVLPGDSLVTSCWYNTEERANITLGGFAISDEMCVNYIHYFPKADLEVCKSSVSNQALKDYFSFLKSWEDQSTNQDGPISENYQSVTWTPLRVKLLDDLYTHAPLSMQCNRSDGSRFPGLWEGLGNVWPHLPTLLQEESCSED